MRSDSPGENSGGEEKTSAAGMSQTTGIWKTVWLEEVPEIIYIRSEDHSSFEGAGCGD